MGLKTLCASQSEPAITVSSGLLVTRLILVAMSHIFGCKQTPPTPPTTSDEEVGRFRCDCSKKFTSVSMYVMYYFAHVCKELGPCHEPSLGKNKPKRTYLRASSAVRIVLAAPATQR